MFKQLIDWLFKGIRERERAKVLFQLERLIYQKEHMMEERGFWYVASEDLENWINDTY